MKGKSQHVTINMIDSTIINIIKTTTGFVTDSGTSSGEIMFNENTRTQEESIVFISSGTWKNMENGFLIGRCRIHHWAVE